MSKKVNGINLYRFLHSMIANYLNNNLPDSLLPRLSAIGFFEKVEEYTAKNTLSIHA